MTARRVYAECSAVFGPRFAGWATAAVVAGCSVFVIACLLGAERVALGVLAASWLVLAGLAAGGVAFSAAIRLSNGRWATAALPAAEATAGFFPAALAVLAVLVLAARFWIPGAAAMDWGVFASRALRDLLSGVLLVAAASRLLGRPSAPDARLGVKPSGAAVAYLFVFVGVLSLWAVDLVMDLHEWAPSTVVPPFYFISGLLAGVAWTAVVGGGEAGVEPRARHDLGKLLFAFTILWGYLLWAEYLAVWYGNIPDETGQLLARWGHDWKFLSLGVLATVLGFPFLFLMPERFKKGRVTLAVAGASILAGLLGEGWLLVLPSLDLRWGWLTLAAALVITAGMVGLFALTSGARLARTAIRTPAGEP